MNLASRPAARPTLRTLAEAAGVTAMTVSLALRNHARIPLSTRRRIQKIAQRHGYTPDPALTKLMHHLRARRTTRLQASLCAFNTWPGAADSYCQAIIDSAQQRAAALGFAFSVIDLPPGRSTSAQVQRLLRNRGIEGILIPPLDRARPFRPKLDWSQFSVVAATYSVTEPAVNRVVPDQFGNMMRVCAELGQRGYRRIGLVQSIEGDRRVRHQFSAALAWHVAHGGGAAIRPLITPALTAEPLRHWLEQERPDVLVFDNDQVPAIVKKLRAPATSATPATPACIAASAPVAFFSLNTSREGVFPGIDQRTDLIGASAVNLLASMLQRGERGLPDSPQTTLITGRWHEEPPVAPTLQRRKSRLTLQKIGSKR